MRIQSGGGDFSYTKQAKWGAKSKGRTELTDAQGYTSHPEHVTHLRPRHLTHIIMHTSLVATSETEARPTRTIGKLLLLRSLCT